MESGCSLGASPESGRQCDREHEVAGLKSKYGAKVDVTVSLKVGFHLVFHQGEDGDRLQRL